jgi:membrane protease YdiL (CAAX protease family)
MPASDKRKRWFELYLVLWVACGAPLLNSLYLLTNGPGTMPHISNARWIIGTLQEISALLLLGYVLSRRGLGFKDLGLRWSFRDAGMGILVAALSIAAYMGGSIVIQFAHRWLYGSFAHGPTAKDFFAHPSLLAIPFFLLNPFFEELIVRAYFMTEISQLTGSSALAVILSVALQFSYHLYYGWTAAAALACGFMVFALYYARTRRALPIIVAHAVIDLYGLVRLL